jgi:hypothetical protein
MLILMNYMKQIFPFLLMGRRHTQISSKSYDKTKIIPPTNECVCVCVCAVKIDSIYDFHNEAFLDSKNFKSIIIPLSTKRCLSYRDF